MLPTTTMNLDFSLILFCLVVATGAVWLGDVAVFRRTRRSIADRVLETFDRQTHTVTGAPPHDERERLRERLLRPPGWIELPAGFFPVLLAVFLLRSFVFEPFRIPSGSMMPTLEVGDFILVNKFVYGLRLPIVGTDVVTIGAPERGDVVVFRYPLDPSENYVKRVVGLPGDTIVYRDKRLTINGRPVATSGAAAYVDEERATTVIRSSEALPRGSGAVVHDVLFDPRRDDAAQPMTRFPFLDRCRYAAADASIACTVPSGHYFVMGDNRDNSADSRYWGFVPDENLVGRAAFVWMNFAHPRRIGGFH